MPVAGFIDFACEGDEIGVEPEPLEIFVTPPGQDKIQLYMGRAVTFELLAESVEEVVSDPYPCYARASAASPRTYDDGIWDCTLLVSPSPDVVELLWKPSTTDFEASWEFQYPFAMQLLDYSLGDLGGQVEAFGSVVTDVAGMPSGLQYDEVKSWTLRAVRRAEALPITKVGDLNPKWSSKKGGPKKSTSVWATALPYSLRLHSAVWADAFGNSITEILGGYAKGRPPKVFIKPSYPF